MAATCNRKVVTTAVAASVAAAAKAAAAPGVGIIVPESMQLRDATKEADFQKCSLIPLDIKAESHEVKESAALTSGDVLKRFTGKHGSICFVVRRPG